MSNLKRKIKYNKKRALTSLAFIIFILLVIGGLQVANAEWQEPSSPPPLEQMYAPITAGPENQTKSGLLELNPLYSPTADYSLIFQPRKPLDVKGVGALFTTSFLYNDLLTVDTDTLYVDSVNEWVSIGATDVQAGMDAYNDPWLPSATNDYEFRKKINFDTYTMDSAATNIPVMIKADNSMGVGFWQNIDSSSGADIVFADSLGNHLTHHFEIFDSTLPEYKMIAWVNVPTINIPTDYIYIYYGNSSPDPVYVADEAGTYDSDFVMVQHMNDDAPGILGSTTSAVPGTKVGDPTQVTGQINNAQQFDGDDHIDLGNILSPGTDDWTVEVWFQSNLEDDTERIIYNKETRWAAKTGDNYFKYAWQPNFEWRGNDSFTVSEDEWYHSTVVYDHSTQRSYKNGNLAYVRNLSGDMGTDTTSLYIGARSDSGPRDYFIGLVDEMRVSNTARSRDWVQASYLSGADQLVSSWGVVELGGGTSSIISTKLWVSNGGVQVGSPTIPIDGRAVSAYGDDLLISGIYGVGIYGEAQGDSSSGIYGLRSDATGWAVKGVSENNVGVKGESVYGQGIYAVNDNINKAAVYGQNTSTGWAGYFDGPLVSGSDIVSNRFTPSGLGQSIISFTSGQEIDEHDLGGGLQDGIYTTFDGTYIWAAGQNRSPDNFFQIRASDGKLMNSWLIGLDLSFSDVVYDGQYVWLADSSGYGNVIRFNPEDYTYQSVGGLSSNPKYDIEVSSINGQTYIWAMDRGASQLYKINASTLAIDTTMDLNIAPLWLSNPMGMEYDGTYIWIAFSDNGIGRISAESPAGTLVFVETSIAFDCQPHGVLYDGVNVWCLHGQGGDSGQILRMWPDVFPNVDPQYPLESFGPSVNHQKRAIFDGTYLWTISLDVPYAIYKYEISDPTEYETISLDYQPHDITFDGTYIWVSEGGAQPKLHQYYSGTGFGHTDLNTVVNLDPDTAEFGNINITEAAEVGADITVGGDLDVLSNQWGDIYQTANAVDDCLPGYYMSGVQLIAGDITTIICHRL